LLEKYWIESRVDIEIGTAAVGHFQSFASAARSYRIADIPIRRSGRRYMLKKSLFFGLMAASVGWLAYFYWRVLRRSLTSRRIQWPLPGWEPNCDLEKNPSKYWFAIGIFGVSSAVFAAMAIALLLSAFFSP